MNSKFSKIFAARNGNPTEESAAETGDEQSAPSPAPAPPMVPETPGAEAITKEVAVASIQAKKQKKNPPEKSPSSTPHPPLPTNGKPPGRPAGKRSNPDFGQVTAYIRKETYRDVQGVLFDTRDGRDFSELVEELLTKWLRTRT